MVPAMLPCCVFMFVVGAVSPELLLPEGSMQPETAELLQSISAQILLERQVVAMASWHPNYSALDGMATPCHFADVLIARRPTSSRPDCFGVLTMMMMRRRRRMTTGMMM